MDSSRQRWLLLAFLALSICLFIAGAVMLGIGIHKASPKKDSTPTNTVSTIGSVLHLSTNLPSVKWQAAFADVSSAKAQKAIQDAQSELLAALKAIPNVAVQQSGNRMLRAAVYEGQPLGVAIDYLQKSVDGASTDVFGSAVFSGRVADQNVIQAQLTAGGWPSYVFSSSAASCKGGPSMPPSNGLDTTTTTLPPSTTSTQSTTTTHPVQSDFPCVTSSTPHAAVVMVDVSAPAYPAHTMQDKRSAIQSILLSLAPTSDNWGSLQMGLGVYYDNQAYFVRNFLSSSGEDWKAGVASLDISVSETHNTTRAFEFVLDELSNERLQLQAGTARSLILIADGLEMDSELPRSLALSQKLQQQQFYIGAVVANKLVPVRSAFSSLVSSPFALLSSTWWYQLVDSRVTHRQRQWICQAVPYTTLAPSTAWTQPVFTETARTVGPTNSQPTAAPTLSPSCVGLRTLFFIDMSQAIGTNYASLQQFLIDSATKESLAGNATFALLAFQGNVVKSTIWLSLSDFTAAVQSTPLTIGDVSYSIGFKALDQFFSDNGFSTTVPTTVVFVTTASPSDGSSVSVRYAARQIAMRVRCQHNAQILSFVVNGGSGAQTLVQECTAAGDRSCSASSSLLVSPSYTDLAGSGAALVASNLDCEGASPHPTSTCPLDVIFLVETSLITTKAGGQLFARGLLSAYMKSAKLGPINDRTSVIYYSNSNGLPNAPANVSGVLFDLDSSTSANSREALAAVQKFFPAKQGVFSDIDLALKLAMQTEHRSRSGNTPTVVIIGRGAYEDFSSNPCCSDPWARAAALREDGVRMRGAVVGFPDANATVMHMITGEDNFQVSSFDLSTAEKEGAALLPSLTHWLDQVRAASKCSAPTPVTFCPKESNVLTVIETPGDYDLFISYLSFIEGPFLDGIGYGHGSELNPLTRLAVSSVSDAVTKLNPTDLTLQSVWPKDKAEWIISQTSYRSVVDQSQDVLARIYNNAYYELLNAQSSSRTSSVVVFLDDLSKLDRQQYAEESYRQLKTLDIGVFIVSSSSKDLNFTGLADAVISISSNDMKNKSSIAALQTANFLGESICNVPYHNVSSPSVTVAPPVSTLSPEGAPQLIDGVVQWPDVTILLDTSTGDFTGGFGDRGFEVMRQFLLRTLSQFKMGGDNSRVALITYDGTSNLVFHLSEHLDWESLQTALTTNWQYGPASKHTTKRDIQGALTTLLKFVYNPNRGFRLKKNALWVFTTGPDSTNSTTYQDTLRTIEADGVQVTCIALGVQPDDYLSTLGVDVIKAERFLDEKKGLAGERDKLSGVLFEKATRGHQSPCVQELHADIVFAVDVSNMKPDTHKFAVLPVLNEIVQSATIGASVSRISVLSFSDVVDSQLTLLQGIDKQAALAAIQQITPQPNVKLANYTTALNAISSQLFSKANGWRMDQPATPTYLIFLSANNDTIGLTTSALTPVKAKSTVFSLSFNQDMPSFMQRLSTKSRYAFSLGPYPKWGTTAADEHPPLVSFFEEWKNVELAVRVSSDAQPIDLRADIVFAIDQTGMSPGDFANVKQYIKDFMSRVQLSAQKVQIGALTFTSHNVEVLSLSSCSSLATCEARIDALVYNSTGDASGSSGIVGALDYIASISLRPSQGWRSGLTYVITMVTSTNYNQPPSAAASVVNELRSKNAHVVGIDLTGGNARYIGSFSLITETVPSPLALAINTQYDKDLNSYVMQAYKDDQYPPYVHLKDVYGTFIFLVDQASLTTAQNDEICDMIDDFIDNSHPIEALFGVHSFNGDTTTSFEYLATSHEEAHVLVKAIRGPGNQLPNTNTTNIVEMFRTLSYIAVEYNVGEPIFFIILSNTPDLYVPILYPDPMQKIMYKWVPYAYFAFDIGRNKKTYNWMAELIPEKYQAGSILRTDSVDKDSDAVKGPNGLYSYVRNKYTAFKQEDFTTSTPPSGAPIVRPFPLMFIRTDIVIILDSSANVDVDSWRNALLEIAAFSLDYTIGGDSAHISVVLFDEASLSGSFLLGDVTSSEHFEHKIISMQFPQSKLSFDPVKAYTYVSSSVLTAATRARPNAAPIILLWSTSTSVSTTCDKMQAAVLQLPTLSVWGMASNRATTKWMRCAVPDAAQITIYTGENKRQDMFDFDNFVSFAFETFENSRMWSLPMPTEQVYYDIVFIIDQSRSLSYDQFETLKEVMANTLIDPLTIGRYKTQVAVLSFDSQMIPQGTFGFSNASNWQSLKDRIYNLKYAFASHSSFDILAAAQYAQKHLLTPSAGHDAYKPVAMVVLTANSETKPVPPDVQYPWTVDAIQAVAAKASFFGFSLSRTTRDASNFPAGSMQNIARFAVSDYLVSVDGPESLTDASPAVQRFKYFLANTNLEYLQLTPLLPLEVRSNVIVIVDTTQALSQSFWKPMQESLKDMVARFPFHITKFGFLFYDQEIQTSIYLHEYKSQQSLFEAIDALPWKKSKYERFDPAGAIDSLVSLVFGYNLKSLTIVTMGYSPTSMLSNLNCSSVALASLPSFTTFFGISMETASLSSLPWLACMASDGSDLISASAGASLNEWQLARTQYTIAREYQLVADSTPISMPVPLAQKQVDLVFVIDGSFYTSYNSLMDYIMPFVRDFMRRFTYSTSLWAGAQASVVITGGPSILFHASQSFDDFAMATMNIKYEATTILQPDLNATLRFLQRTVLTESAGKRMDVPTVVIWMLTSPFPSTPVDASLLQAVNMLSSQFGLNLFGYPEITDAIMEINGAKENALGVVSSPLSLFSNQMQLADLRLASFVSNAHAKWRTALFDVVGDIVFLLDTSTSLTIDEWVHMNDFVSEFASAFTVLSSRARVAYLQFTDEMDGNPIFLSSSSSIDEFKVQLHKESRVGISSEFDVIHALNFVNSSFLNPSNGWRSGFTTVMVMSATPTVSTSCDALLNFAWPQSVEVLALALNNLQTTSNWMHCLTGDTKNFARSAPETLTTDSLASNVLSEIIAKGYDVYSHTVQPPFPLSISKVAADVVFIIDASMFTTPTAFGNIKSALSAFIDPWMETAMMQLAVVSWDYGVVDSGTFSLSETKSLSSLVGNLTIPMSNSSSFDVDGAILYTLSTVMNARGFRRPVATFILASSPDAVINGWSNVNELKALGPVFTIDATDLGADNNYLFFLSSSSLWTARMKHADDLSKDENQYRMEACIAYSYYTALTIPTVPSLDVVIDVVFVVDTTTNNDNLIASLITLVDSYTFGLTQFEIVFYGQNVTLPRFAFNSFNSKESLIDAISKIIYYTDGSVFDVKGALSFVRDVVLQSAEGYRGQATEIILLSSSSNVSTNCNNGHVYVEKLNVDIAGIAFEGDSGTPSSWMWCVVSSRDELAILPADSPVLISGIYQTLIVQRAIADSYYGYFVSHEFTTPIDLQEKSADIVFVIDRSWYTDAAFPHLIQFISDYAGNFKFSVSYKDKGATFGVIGAGARHITWINLFDNRDLASFRSELSQIKEQLTTEMAPNLEDTLNEVYTNMLTPEYGRRDNVPAVVVIFLASPWIAGTLPSADTIQALNQKASVVGVNLYGYRECTEALMTINNQNIRGLVMASGPESLQGKNSLAVKQLSAFISQAPSPYPVPIHDIASDVVFVVDTSASLTQTTMENIQMYIKTVAEQFTYANKFTKFAVLFYSNQVDGFPILFNSVATAYDLTVMLDNMQMTISNDYVWDAAGALNFVAYNILTREAGWRQRSTQIVFFASAPTANYSSCGRLQDGVDQFVVDMTNGSPSPDYVKCLASQPGYVVKAHGYYFNADSYAGNMVLQFVSSSYEQWIDNQPTDLPIPDVQVSTDLVFIIDETLWVGSSYNDIKTIMMRVVSLYNLDKDYVQAGFVRYTSTLVGAAPLTTDIVTQISQLNYTYQAESDFDLDSALQFTLTSVLTPTEGHKPGRPATIVILASTPYLTKELSADTIEKIGAETKVIGLDLFDYGATEYLSVLCKAEMVIESPDPKELTLATNEWARLHWAIGESVERVISHPAIPPADVPVDIVFIVDVTGAVDTNAFQQMKTSLMTIAGQYSIGQRARVGVLFWDTGRSPMPEIYLGAYNTVEAFEKAVIAVPLVGGKNGTFDVVGAFSWLTAVSLSPGVGRRADLPLTVVVLAANGQSNAVCGHWNTSLPVNSLVYGVAFTMSSSEPEKWLSCIASSKSSVSLVPYSSNLPNDYRLHKLTYAIDTMYALFVQSQNYDTPIPLEMKAVDVILVVDASYATDRSYTQIGAFLTALVTQFDIGLADDQARFGLMNADGEGVSVFLTLGDSKNVDEVTDAISILLGDHQDTTAFAPNMSAVFSKLSDMLSSDDRRSDVPTVVVFFIASRFTSVFTIPSYQLAELTSTSGVFGVNLYGDPAVDSVLLQLNGGNARALGSVSSPATLDTNSIAYKQLASFVSNAHSQFAVPLREVHSDIVFVVDATGRMYHHNYNTVLDWISVVAGQFVVNPAVTQIGLLTYTNTTVGTPIVFNSAASVGELRQALSTAKHEFKETTLNEFDASGAVNAVSSIFLQDNLGWRQGHTVVVFVSIADTALVPNCNTDLFVGPVQVLSLMLNQKSYDWTRCLLGGSSGISLDNPDTIRGDSIGGITVLDRISSGYLKYIQSLPASIPVPLKKIYSDIIFVIDETSMVLSQQRYSQIKQFLLNFIRQLDLANDFAQVGYVRWSDSLLGSSMLTSTSLVMNRIYNMNYTETFVDTFDVKRALDYTLTMLRPSQGHTAGRTAQIIIVASSPMATQMSSDETLLLSQADVFGLDVLGSGAVAWLPYVTNDASCVMTVRDLAELSEKTSAGYQRVSSFVSEAYFSRISTPPIPLYDLVEDVVYLVDTSSSMTSQQFMAYRDTIVASISTFHLSDGVITRVGILFFDTNVTYTPITLGQYKDETDVETALNQIDYIQSTNGFDVQGAFDYLQNVYLQTGARKGAAISIIVLTASASPATPSVDYSLVGCNVKQPGNWNVFGVAFTQDSADPTQWLYCIATPESAVVQTMFQMAMKPDYYQFTIMQYSISQAYSSWLASQEYTLQQPLSSLKLDLVFVIDWTYFTEAAWSTQIQPFLINYVQQFTIGPDFTQVGIVVVTGNRVNTYLDLSGADDADELVDMINQLTSDSPYDRTLTFTLSQLTDYLLEYILVTPFGRRPAVPAAVVALFASPLISSNDVPSYSLDALSTVATVFGVNLYGYAATSQAILTLNGGDARSLSIMQSPASLTMSSHQTQQLNTVLSSAEHQTAFPLTDLSTDIVFIIDSTAAMTDAAFSNVVKFLGAVTKQLTVSPNRVQVALVWWDTYQNKANPTFMLNSTSLNNEMFQTTLNNLTPPRSNATVFAASIAMEYVNTVLSPENGWRQKQNYVVVIAISDEVEADCFDPSPLPPDTAQFVLSLSANPSVAQSMWCMSDVDVARSDPAAIGSGRSSASALLLDYAASAFMSYRDSHVPVLPLPIQQITTDIVFVIDQTRHIGKDGFDQAKSMILRFLDTWPMDYGEVQIAVISLSDEVLLNSSTLNFISKKEDAVAAINALPWANSTAQKLHLGFGLYHLVVNQLGATMGHTPYIPAAVIFLAASPLASFYDRSTVDIIQLKEQADVFAFDIKNHGAASNYLYSLLGSADNVRVIDDMSTVIEESPVFNTLQSFLGNAFYWRVAHPLVPAKAVQTDIILLVDASKELTPVYFTQMKRMLIDFIDSFRLGRMATQIGVLFWDKQAVYELTLGHDLSPIMHLNFTQSTSDFDYYGAISYLQAGQLSGPTFRHAAYSVVVFGYSDIPNFDCLSGHVDEHMIGAAMSTTTFTPKWMTCYLKPFMRENYVRQLAGMPPVDWMVNKVVYKVTNAYQKYLEKLPIVNGKDLKDVNADIVWVLDESYYVQGQEKNIAQYLIEMSLQLNQDSRFALIGASDSPHPYFTFTNGSMDAIKNLLEDGLHNHDDLLVYPDVNDTISYTLSKILQRNNGWRGNVADTPTYVIYLLGSPLINPTSAASISLLAESSTASFGVNLFGYSMTHTRLLQLTGSAGSIAVANQPADLLNQQTLVAQQINAFLTQVNQTSTTANPSQLN